MINFCTLFDSFYLTRGLALYTSLENTCDSFHLYIFAFDDKSFDILNKLNLKNATIISLLDFENDRLLAVKQSRSRAEYCWTCTSSTILYVIEKYNVSSCTYLDADLYFYKDPKLLLDEMGDKSILITEHRYSKLNRSDLSGIYCVQFITFVNDENGLAALRWWRDACIDWCYDRYEDGKFGDQKYLDDWPSRFQGVHVLQHLGGGLASWNVGQYSFIERAGNKIVLLDKKDNLKFEAVFYHFHHVRFFVNDIVDLGWHDPTLDVIDNLYVPYIIELKRNAEAVKSLDSEFNIHLIKFNIDKRSGPINNLKYLIKYFVKVVCRYNVFNTKNLIAKYHAKRLANE